jgi:hypothetical protein
MMTSDQQSSVEKMLSQLRYDRDELRVQMHLAKLELQQEWSRLENKWTEIDDRTKPTRQATQKSAQDLWESVKLVAEEIGHGYRRIRESLGK